MSDASRITKIEQDVKDLNKKVQSFDVKMEHGWAKADLVGATGTATAVSAEVTGLSGGFKLANFEYDVVAQIKEAKLRRAGQMPDQLQGSVTRVSEKAGRAVTGAQRAQRTADQALRKAGEAHRLASSGNAARRSANQQWARQAQQTRTALAALQRTVDSLSSSAG